MPWEVGQITARRKKYHCHHATKTTVCPQTGRRAPAPLKAFTTLIWVASLPQGQTRCQKYDILPKERALNRIHDSLLESAQVAGTQSSAIKAQQLNKLAPVSWPLSLLLVVPLCSTQSLLWRRPCRERCCLQPSFLWVSAASHHLLVSAGKSKAEYFHLLNSRIIQWLG